MGQTDAVFSRLLSSAGDRAERAAIYQELHRSGALFHSATGAWVVSRYEDCNRVLRAPEFGVDWPRYMRSLGLEGWREYSSLRRIASMLISANRPRHTLLRRLVAQAFTSARMRDLRPEIERIAATLLDVVDQADAPDLVRDYAAPLPIAVIGELLGVPELDRAQFRRLIQIYNGVLSEGEPTADRLAAADEATQEMEQYFQQLLATRRARPTGDLLSALVQVEENGWRLSEDELISMAIVLMGGGFDTTTHLIANGLAALLLHPEQLELVHRQRALLPQAVEEVLRLDGPIQLAPRAALADIVLGGHTISAGDVVTLVLGAANRDPAYFEDPDRFNMNRPSVRSLAFGAGVHTCLGAPLARLEAEVSIGAILDRYPHLHLAGGPPMYRGTLSRSTVAALPVALH